MKAAEAVCPFGDHVPSGIGEYGQYYDVKHDEMVTARRDDGLLLPVHRHTVGDQLQRNEQGIPLAPVAWLGGPA